MKYNIKSLLLFFVLLVTISCDKEFLDEYNPNGVSSDIFWSNLDEVESSLTGVYSSMLNTYVHNTSAEAVRSDMGFPRNRANPSGFGVPFYQQTFTNGDSRIKLKWEACYQVIFRSNQVIEGLKTLEGGADIDTERWKVQMAQARFFRGLVHFYLHSTFNGGQIIIRDNVPQSNEDFNKGLSTSEEVISFFREDLKYAYENLPARYDASADKGRATAGAAATILGTSHLYEGQYPEAMNYFNDVIGNSAYGYELVKDMSLLFTSAGEFNKESILEINYTVDTQLEDSQWDEESFNTRLARYTAPNNRGGGGAEHFFPTAWITNAYANEPLDTLDSRNFVNDGMGGSKLRNVSLRASSMIALVQDEATEYYFFPSMAELCGFTSGSFSWYKKYTNHDIADREHETGLTPWKSGKNLTLNRLSEVYLMRAECKIQSGDIEGALDDMNEVRARWGLLLLGANDGTNHAFDGVAYNKESLMEHLMDIERPLELSIEGHALRTIDLRRWGIAKQRYEYLASLDFHTENYQFVNSEGADASCNNSILVEGPGTGNSNVKEFELAAQNYNSDLHGYLPIPLSEIQNNSAIN